jgi:glycosyltransferase involved in cell wall biosynthesis
VHLFFRRPVPGEHFSIERLFTTIAAALPKERYEVECLVCPFQSAGVIRRLLLILWGAVRQGDINHITGDVNFLGLLMRQDRTILTLQDSASMERLKGWRRLIYRTFWLSLPIARAGRVTVASGAVRAETEAYLGRQLGEARTIAHCVTRHIQFTRTAFNDRRSRLLAVGSKPNKNLDRVISALDGIPCRLVVVGSLSAAQRALVSETGVDIENHVNLDDEGIAAQYRLADVVLFVSTYEGFGLPILEAQATGRPLITSRRSPMQEVAGEGACLVNPEDVHEIRDAVLRVLQDKDYRDSLVEAGLRNVKQYAPEVIARRYAALYEEMLAIGKR